MLGRGLRFWFLGALGAVAVAAPAVREEAARVTGEVALATDMAEAAGRFLSALTPEQRRRANLAFAADERKRWHYVPQARKGIPFADLGPAQRHLAYGFLATALSRQGLLKASTIMALEEVLRRRGSTLVRDPEAYHLTIFGEPALGESWGWRLEGHHVSINVTLVDGVRLVTAPLFLGANPARVDGEFLGHARVLGREEDLGFRLLASLDDEQRRQAIYKSTAPDDILTGPGAGLGALPGLPAARMNAEQRRLLDAIVDEAAGNLPPEQAALERERMARVGGELQFTWAGGGAPTEPHYYRVAGPTFLYELDNTQDGANHVHTVWHTRETAGGDFGDDLLRRHLQAQPHRALSKA
ncbi:MAG TPA: DUF3500 domain-containing protein, partial [Planctomycetota bacterium]|nr:DUF3500 domain-containing protein [Planctomycetota bacterium]